MDELELLTRVRELLTDPNHWTREAWARKADGAACSFDDPDAGCWCLVGALMYVDPTVMPNVLQRRVTRVGYENIVMFNDDQEHAGVLALLDEAIYALKEERNAQG